MREFWHALPGLRRQCKAVYLPEKNDEGVRVFDQPSELHCSICDAALFPAVLARHRLLYCTKCHGHLVPMPVFVELIAVLRAQRGDGGEIAPPPDPHQLDRAVLCPQCRNRMDTHYFAGGGNVVIDDCSRCELDWLDAGELMAIAHAPDHWQDSRIRMDES